MKQALTFLLILTSFNIFSQQVRPEFVDSIINVSLKKLPQAGLAVGIIEQGEVAYLKGYGIKSADSGDKVDKNTLFAIASNSKAFTSTALAILVDNGKLKWTDKVIDYVPEFRMHDPYVTANFTIVDLLTHRSGLGLGAGDLMFFPDGTDFGIEDVLSGLQHLKPVSDFRTKFDYDNLLYMVAGEVVNRVSGKPWDKFVEEEIMRPIGMPSSFAALQNIPKEANVAKPHRVNNDGTITQLEQYTGNKGSFGAAGGVFSNVTDLSKWVSLHLNAGKYGDSLNTSLISTEAHQELWNMHTILRFNANGNQNYNSHYQAYGLGFFITDWNGYTIIQHSGGLPGMLSMITMIPELDFGVIVLTNAEPGGFSYFTITQEIIDEVIGGDRDWVSFAQSRLEASVGEEDSVLTAVWDKVKLNKKIKIDQSKYIGTYEDNWFGTVEIFEKGKEMWITCKRSPKLTGQMHFYNANTFAVDWEYDDMECDAFATFLLDESGKAQSFKMKGISPDIDFSFDFHDLDLRRVK